MRYKAFIGIVVICLIFAANILFIGNKNLWFESMNEYWTLQKSGEGLSEGTLVTFSGLKVGAVTALDIADDNHIKVIFRVRSSLAKRIREGAKIQVTRSMMIGDKELQIIPGPRERAALENHQFIPSTDMMELADLIGSDQMVQVRKMLPKIERIVGNVDQLLAAFAGKPELADLLMETLREANVTMKAFQQSFILKGTMKKMKASEGKK